MAGCGIRSLRWALEADINTSRKAEGAQTLLCVNDADPDRAALLQSNLNPLQGRGIQLDIRHEDAADLLARIFLEKRFFDLIDLDAFGCPNALLQSVIQVLRFDGILFMASSDGRGPTGHDRLAAIRSLAAAARAHPSSWEIALRLQLGALARHAWQLGRGINPLFSFSDGRTFRLAVRLIRAPVDQEEHLLGFLARCERCGVQMVQSMINLGGWGNCDCSAGQGRWAVNGPLWLGKLQSQGFIDELLLLAGDKPQSVSSKSLRLLRRLHADPGLPVICWSTSELASRLALSGPPKLADLVSALRKAGCQAFSSSVMPGQLRTDATLEQIFGVCRSLVHERA